LIHFLYLLGLSFSAEKSVNLFDYVAKSSDDEPLVFVVSYCACKLGYFDPLLMLVRNPILSAHYLQVGAMAHGKIDKEYTDDYIQSK